MKLVVAKTVSLPPPRHFDHLVAGIVDIVGVVARAPGQNVGPRLAVELVVARAATERIAADTADQGVRQFVARQGETRGARHPQEFDLLPCPQREVGGGKDGVAAAARHFDHLVAGIVDEVGVVARAPGQNVGPRLAVELVVARAATERIAADTAVR